MSNRTADHSTFTINRTFAASPAQAFAAWADPAAKARWFAEPPSWQLLERQHDFRAGGREVLRGRWENGTVSAFDARYWDIVPDRRIVYTYDMHLDDRRISVSLSTVEFEPSGTGTRMRYTEQAVFLDGYDDASSREKGTQGLIDRLEASLEPGARA